MFGATENLKQNLSSRLETDGHPLTIDRLVVNGVNLSLIGLDHKPTRQPKIDPWQVVENEVKDSSLVFAEYPLPTLQYLWNHPFAPFGQYALWYCEKRGITGFSHRIANIAKQYNKNLADADIASGPMYEIGYYFLLNTALPWIIPVVASAADDNYFLPALSASVALNMLSLQQETHGVGMFGTKPHGWEKYALHPEDARRLVVAEGIAQETKRTIPGSKLIYVAPPAHTARVKMYLENLRHPAIIVKKNIWLRAPGLDRSIRKFKYNPQNDSWEQLSTVAIAP